MKILGAVLYKNFELLDLYGPLEVFGNIGPELKPKLKKDKRRLAGTH